MDELKTDELRMVREMLPAAPPRPEVTAAARARLLATGRPAAVAGSRRRRPRPGGRRPGRWLGVAVPLTAGALIAALVLVAGPGLSTLRHGPQVTGSVSPARGGHAPARTITLSARQVFLAAAISAARQPAAPSSGRYWLVRTVGMQLTPSGSASDPYNIAYPTSGDTWYARAAGQPSVFLSQDLAGYPATPADAAAWRSDGSPRGWITGLLGGTVRSPRYRYRTMAAGAPAVWSLDMKGEVGDAVGDGSWLTAAQFAAFPADPAKLRKLMVHYVYLDYSAVGDQNMPPMDQSLMTEAINLLQDPLPPAVKSAVFRIMASLPGTRSLGAMRDPLGRSGEAIAVGDASVVGGTDGGEGVVIVDPSSGMLLATEVLVTSPGRALRHSGQLVALIAPDGRVGGLIFSQKPARVANLPICQKPRSCLALPVYFGPSYRGQISRYMAIVSAAWTDTPPRTR